MNYSPQRVNLSMIYIKAWHVSLIKICISIYLSWHVSYMIKRSIHHQLPFIHSIYYHHKQKLNQSINHMNTEVFTWKPSDWGENHGSFTIFKNYFSSFNLSWGNNPLQLLYQSTHGMGSNPFIQWHPDSNRKGLQPLHAYNIGPSTTLPPYYDHKRKEKEKTQDSAMDCLISLI